MQIEELQKRLESEDVEFRGNCHDCGALVEVLCAITENGEFVITGGAIFNPKVGVLPAELTFFKCDACFQKEELDDHADALDRICRSISEGVEGK